MISCEHQCVIEKITENDRLFFICLKLKDFHEKSQVQKRKHSNRWNFSSYLLMLEGSFNWSNCFMWTSLRSLLKTTDRSINRFKSISFYQTTIIGFGSGKSWSEIFFFKQIIQSRVFHRLTCIVHEMFLYVRNVGAEMKDRLLPFLINTFSAALATNRGLQ